MLKKDNGAESYFEHTADILEEHTQEILADYEERLHAMDSPLIGDKAMRREVEMQARYVLEETVRNLRKPGSSEGLLDTGLSRTIGEQRAREAVHPSESFRAVAALCGATLDVVAEHLSTSGMGVKEVGTVASAISQSVMDRVAQASIAYGEYLLRNIHKAHHEERQRISRELHDRLAPIQVSVLHSLEIHDALQHRNPLEAKAKAELARTKAREAVMLTKELSRELRMPEAPDGLEVALSDFLETEVPENVRAWVSMKGDEDALPHYLRDEVFLILREGIRNAITHAKPRTIRVVLRIDQTSLAAEVQDDGRGFRAKDPAGEVGRAGDGIGLRSMEERASLLGGTFEVSSEPGRGSTVAVKIPLARSAH